MELAKISIKPNKMNQEIVDNNVPDQVKKALADSFPELVKFEFAHNGACNGQLGLEIMIISDEFKGIKLLDRHR